MNAEYIKNENPAFASLYEGMNMQKQIIETIAKEAEKCRAELIRTRMVLKGLAKAIDSESQWKKHFSRITARQITTETGQKIQFVYTLRGKTTIIVTILHEPDILMDWREDKQGLNFIVTWKVTEDTDLIPE